MRRKLVPVLAALSLVGMWGAQVAAAKASGESITHLLLVLNHPEAGLSRFVAAVSDPTSPHYRHYLSIEQLVKRYGASDSTRQAVARWLRANHLHGRFDPTETLVDVSTTPSRRAGLFAPAGASSAGRHPARLAVPQALRDTVSRVLDGEARLSASPAASSRARPAPLRLGGETFDPRGSSVRMRTGTPAGCRAGTSAGVPQNVVHGITALTPNQYLSAYGFPRLIRQDLRGTGERIALVEFGGFKRSDVATFVRCFGLPMPRLRVIPVATRSSLPPLNETELDLEVVAAAAPRATSIDVYEGVEDTYAGFVGTVAEPLRQRARRPNVVSMSYGVCEARLAGIVQLADAVNSVLEFEAAAGISVFDSADDTGSSGCSMNHNGSALALQSADFPASPPPRPTPRRSAG